MNKYDKNTNKKVLRAAKTLHSLVEEGKATAKLYLDKNEVRFQGI